MNEVSGAVSADEAGVVAPTSVEDGVPEVVVSDVLVEEVSIDGMCGVY